MVSRARKDFASGAARAESRYSPPAGFCLRRSGPAVLCPPLSTWALSQLPSYHGWPAGPLDCALRSALAHRRDATAVPGQAGGPESATEGPADLPPPGAKGLGTASSCLSPPGPATCAHTAACQCGAAPGTVTAGRPGARPAPCKDHESHKVAQAAIKLHHAILKGQHLVGFKGHASATVVSLRSMICSKPECSFVAFDSTAVGITGTQNERNSHGLRFGQT